MNKHFHAVWEREERIRGTCRTHHFSSCLRDRKLGRDLKPGEAADLVAFLNALTGEFPVQTMPRLPAMPERSALD